MKGPHLSAFFQLRLFQVSDPLILQVSGCYIYTGKFSSLVTVMFCYFVVFSSFTNFFFFPTIKRYNFLPLNNFSKIEVIFRFIEVWWRKLQCSTSIFSTTYHFYSPMYVWWEKPGYPIPGRNPEIPQSNISFILLFLEQLQFVIFVVLHFQKGYYKT